MPESDFDHWVTAWLDGRISQEESDELQGRLIASEEARERFREFVRLDAGLREHASVEVSGNHSFPVVPSEKHRSWFSLGWWVPLALAGSLLMIVGGLSYHLGRGQIASVESDVEDSPVETRLAGYATLRRAAGMKWAGSTTSYREGDVLQAGPLKFDAGVAEIDFFCGATLVVEGPAHLILESDWKVEVLSGRLRANVPPAARGFVVKAADAEIEDLGTEFALDVSAEKVQVKVVDGEVLLRGGRHDGDHLVTGQSRSLKGQSAETDHFADLSTIVDVQRRRNEAQQQRFDQWKSASQDLRMDERLIAYYPIAESRPDRFIENAAINGGRNLDGKLVGSVSEVDGRFGSWSTALEFDRPGARVRTMIDGEFHAYTFACWVRIDSLEHVYNALFMADGYENGEPHWQIRDDGRLMFSVMVDQDQDVLVKNRFDATVVRDAGLHRVYMTPPFWDISKSGRWFHLTAVYDPNERVVRQYVDGKQISREQIIDRFHIETLRIGPSEIGNWGQPFRTTPWFAVRNLNGAMDELVIFNASLSDGEVRSLYEAGKPLGY